MNKNLIAHPNQWIILRFESIILEFFTGRAVWRQGRNSMKDLARNFEIVLSHVNISQHMHVEKRKTCDGSVGDVFL